MDSLQEIINSNPAFAANLLNNMLKSTASTETTDSSAEFHIQSLVAESPQSPQQDDTHPPHLSLRDYTSSSPKQSLYGKTESTIFTINTRYVLKFTNFCTFFYSSL